MSGKTLGVITITLSTMLLLLGNAYSAEMSADGTGKAVFEKYCAACHQSGGNLFNPAKTLFRSDLAEHGIETPKDIVKVMRHPGPGMNSFDEKTIPEKMAMEIAEYILDTFRIRL